MTEETKKKTFFGIDMTKYPCVSRSIAVGGTGGILAGLGSFLFTSNVKKSISNGFVTYMVVYAGFGTYCVYYYSKQMKTIDELNKKVGKIIEDNDSPL